MDPIRLIEPSGGITPAICIQRAVDHFGFELTFFRRGVPPDEIETLPSKWSVKDLYLAHFAVSDITGKRFHFSEKLSREGLGKAGADESRLLVWIDDWQAEAATDSTGSHTLRAHTIPTRFSSLFNRSNLSSPMVRTGSVEKGKSWGKPLTTIRSRDLRQLERS